ncbi:MAG TPA: dephospho-CoA kinase [Chitinophagales bacterium]|nr:dephospho-CoA kinase [Chitinophagales bacterium]
MLKIGITGGIATGKSTVCRIFETMNIPVFHADDESKKILFTDEKVIDELRKTFSDEIFSNGIPDRKKIASIVFNNPEKLQQLNSILHPATFKSFNQWCVEKRNTSYVLMEAALIYEAGAEKFLDKVIVVTAPEKIRISRSMHRDHISEKEVLARMKNQWAQEVIAEKANFIIVNDEEELLIPQVITIHERLLRLSGVKSSGH